MKSFDFPSVRKKEYEILTGKSFDETIDSILELYRNNEDFVVNVYQDPYKVKYPNNGITRKDHNECHDFYDLRDSLLKEHKTPYGEFDSKANFNGEISEDEIFGILQKIKIRYKDNLSGLKEQTEKESNKSYGKCYLQPLQKSRNPNMYKAHEKYYGNTDLESLSQDTENARHIKSVQEFWACFFRGRFLYPFVSDRKPPYITGHGFNKFDENIVLEDMIMSDEVPKCPGSMYSRDMSEGIIPYLFGAFSLETLKDVDVGNYKVVSLNDEENTIVGSIPVHVRKDDRILDKMGSRVDITVNFKYLFNYLMKLDKDDFEVNLPVPVLFKLPGKK